MQISAAAQRRRIERRREGRKKKVILLSHGALHTEKGRLRETVKLKVIGKHA